MKKNWFKNKKIILSLIGATALTAVPIIATSCSSTTTKELIDKSYFTSSDGKITSNIDLKRISLESLKTNEGLKSYLKSVVNKIVYNWLQETIKTDNKLKVEYENKISEINDEYDNQIETYKNQHGDNWQIKFQQDLLDKNGGTEQAYKDAKIYEYARSTFSSQIFKNLFLTVYDSSTNKVVLNPTNEQILDGLYGISKTSKTTAGSTKQEPKITYKFDSNAILTSNTTTDPMYAEFQQYLFDQYVELTNPYIINMSLWKYGTPKSGINSYYNIQTSSGDSGDSEGGDGSGGSEGGSSGSENGGATVREGEDSGSGDTSGDTGTTTTTSGSYIYPYFGNENATNTSNGTVTKFTNFLGGSLTTANYITNADLGLKDIPLNLTDDSSTYILAKNSSIFNDLYTEFAAGATYLYGKLGSNGTSGTNRTNANFQSSNIDTQITHNIDISNASDDGLDNITRNFVSKTSLYATTSSSYTNGTSNTKDVKELTLSNDLVKQIVNANGPISKLVDTSGKATNNKVHVIDSFVPGTIKVTSASTNNNSTGSNTNSLSEYLFLRNQAGVHAISIDGSTLINKAKDEKDRKKHAGYVVMYRHLMGSKGMGQSFKIDLSNELNTFFGSNTDWLIYQYATSSNSKNSTSSTQKLLNANFLSQNEKTLSTNISDLIKHLNYYDGVSTATEKMYDAKNTYNANYGYNTYLNGFASNWNYKLSATSKNGLNKSYLYENALLSSTIASPYEKSGAKQQSLYEKTLESVETLLNSLDLSKQVSNFEGFKYSQYLYTSNEFVNGSLLTFMSNTGQLSALIRNDAYKTYISDFYDIENNTFKSSKSSSGLSNGLYNFFYLNLLNSEKIKWLRYDESTKATGTDNLTNIRNYSYSLWKNSGDKDYGTKLTNYSHLYSVVATIKYLTDNNYSRFLEYLRTSIGTNKAFIVWENSINTNLKNLQTTGATSKQTTTPTTSTSITSKSLIEMADDKLTKNVNNSYGGNYVGNLNTINDNNVDNSGFYQTQYNTSFYSVTGNGSGSKNSSNYKIGFKGLQTSSNSSLQSDVTEAIFTKPYNFNIGYKGVLAQYKSKDEIIKLINNSATINTLTTIANSLDAALNYQFLLSEDINNPNTTLNEKKDILVQKVKNFDESYFQSYSGYVGAKQATGNLSNNSDNSNAFSTTEGSVNLYGSFVYQITQKDLASYQSLKNALNSETMADDIIMQLIVQAANQPSLQSEIATKIALSNKFDVYDVRVKDALATDAIYWIKNWKG